MIAICRAIKKPGKGTRISAIVLPTAVVSSSSALAAALAAAIITATLTSATIITTATLAIASRPAASRCTGFTLWSGD